MGGAPAFGRGKLLAAAVAVAAAGTAIVVAAIAGAFAGTSGQSGRAAGGVAAASPVQAGAGAATRGRRRILVLTQTLGYRHASIPVAAAALEHLTLTDPRLRLVFLPGAQSLSAKRLRGAAAVVWCRHAGRGRVFYDALGHFNQTWQDSRQLKLALGGIEWAAGLAGGRC